MVSALFNRQALQKGFCIGKIGSVRVFLHWTFLLLAVALLLVEVTGKMSAVYITWHAIFFLVVFGSIFLHEMAHVLAAVAFHLPAEVVVLLPVGGLTSMENPGNPRQELLISLAGPAANIAVTLLLYPFVDLTLYDTDLVYNPAITLSQVLLVVFTVNAAIGIFNLVPAFPMDGGRVIRALLAMVMDYGEATRLAVMAGKLIAGLFVAGGIWAGNFFFPLLGVLIIFSARKEMQYARLKKKLEGVKLKDVLLHHLGILKANSTVEQISNTLVKTPNTCFLVMDGSRVVGSIRRADVVKAMSARLYKVPIQQLMQNSRYNVNGEEEVASVLGKLLANSTSVYPVWQKGKLIGGVSLDSVTEYLLLYPPGGRKTVWPARVSLAPAKPAHTI